MKSRYNSSVFVHKIIVLFLFSLLPLSINCSNPLKEPFENLTGHWISADGQRHYYFSRRRRLIIIDEFGEWVVNTEFNIGVVEYRVKNKAKNWLYMYFPVDISGHKNCWLTFSDDKKHISTNAFGILDYVDKRQKP